MGSPPVIVDRPIPNRHLQMAFVERKQEVETFATKAAAESFAHRVRLWGPQRRPQNPYTQIGKTSVDIRREYAVAIVDDEAVGMVARQRFPELLQRPFRRGMGRGVEVENLNGQLQLQLHPFVERLIGTLRRERFDRILFWTT